MIKQCRACHSRKLIDILSLGDQYLSDFTDDDSKPPKYPLNVVMCKDCTLVQLKDTTPPSKLYTDHYGYYSGINQTMRNHLKEIVSKAVQYVKLEVGDIVVDIGSNDATLLKNYPKFLIKIGFDPVAKFKKYYDQQRLVQAISYFNADFYETIVAHAPHTKGKKAKIITAISMFYDLDDPNSFLADITRVLDENGVFIIQQNYLGGMLKQKAYDNIVHEHLEYYSLHSLEKLLNRHGLEVFDVEENDLNGGSFRTYIRFMNRLKRMRYKERRLKLNNQWSYYLFALQVKQLKKKLYSFIKEEVDKGKTIYVYGASTRGNTILQYCGLDKNLIKAAVERNPDKWGKKIASVGIPIISEEQARKEKPDYFLVLPWFFKEEFVKREAEYLKSGGHLIFPLPTFEVV